MKLPALFTPPQWCGPRRLDPHQAARVQPSTHDRYRASLRPFIDWLERHKFGPQLACEFDDLIVEYKNDPNKPNQLRKAEMESLVAALEMCVPGFKGQLPWARQVLAGWSEAHVPRHTVPISEGPTYLGAA